MLVEMLGIIGSIISLSGYSVSVATIDQEETANVNNNINEQNTIPMLPIEGMTKSTISGNVGISRVTHVSGRLFNVGIRMTSAEFASFRLDLDLHCHYYNGKTRTIKVARGALGAVNVTWTKNVTIPNVGSHGYVVLTGRASSNVLPTSAVVLEPTAAF